MFTRYSVACFLACVAVCFAQQATQDEINAFLDWFQARGGRAPKLTVKSFEGMGAGVAATAPVQDGDVVIVVPLSSVA